jgi:uncharacterized membrane protein YbhN (UPF0104 family)
MEVEMQTTTDLALPAFDARALARRAAPAAAVGTVAVAAIVLAGGPFAHALERAAGADPRWVVSAAAFEALSFVGYVALLWLVGGRATSRLGLRESAQVTLGGAAATRLLPAGGAGGVAVTVWALRRAGLDSRTAARTLLGFLVVLYAVFFGAIVAAGVALALGGRPLALGAVPAGAAGLAILAALVAGWRRIGVLGEAVRDAIVLVRSADARLAGALAWWAFDAAVLWAMLHALGTPPALPVVVLGYFVGQLANTIPVPGAVSGGMTGVLVACGVDADLALASVLAYRSIAIWLPAPVGLAALGGLRRTVRGWT